MEEKLQSFRSDVYNNIPYAKDAVMNLVDALSSYQAKSVVELSLSPHFTRSHHSIPRALHDCTQGREGFGQTTELNFLECLTKHSPSSADSKYHFLALDGTSQIKPYSEKLPKSIVHKGTPTPGQKPIGVGQVISVVGETIVNDHWFVPYSAERIPPDQCSTTFGLNQASRVAQVLLDKISIIAADAKYSSLSALSQTDGWENQMLLARLGINRVLYYPHEYKPSDISKKGRPAIYGTPFRLSEKQDAKPDAMTEIQHETSKGTTWTITIARFDGLFVKGKPEFNLQDKLFSIFRILVKDSEGKLIYKDPLWLIGSGQESKNISLENVFLGYHLRFNIEHWFRFAKQNLLFGQFQTSDIAHADNWLHFSILATHMLYHAKELATPCHRPWEKPKDRLSPAQVKRVMSAVLDQVGTPACEPKIRGIGKGRIQGSTNHHSRPDLPIEFKGPKSVKGGKLVIKLGSDHLGKYGDVQINAHNLPDSGRELKKALAELFSTGKATLENAA